MKCKNCGGKLEVVSEDTIRCGNCGYDKTL